MCPPRCNICSFRQEGPLPTIPVYHLHFSSVEIRVTQGVEWTTTNRPYLCPTCQCHHPVKTDYGLNVCLSDSQLHGFHNPRDPTVICPPDSIHVDWVTVPGATIPDLQHAWQVDYWKYRTPMRVLLVAGTNDLLKGGDMTSVTNSILHLKNLIDEQNVYHPDTPNEFVMATVLNCPKLTWYPDNGPPPPGHHNRLEEISALNQWIIEFNQGYGNSTPRYHRYGVRSGRKFLHGEYVPMHVHQFKKWRQSEDIADMVHLNDYWRVRLGGAVISYFKSELEKKGKLG